MAIGIGGKIIKVTIYKDNELRADGTFPPPAATRQDYFLCTPLL
jgi:hypothetical protein